MTSFEGFSPAAVAFLDQLGRNNNREWFEEHRAEWESLLLQPAKLFVDAMGAEFKRAKIDVHAEPKVTGSIFRINRDTRFSKDKRPYKSHLDMWFWQGAGPSRRCPGYFFRLNAASLVLGAGMHAFDKALLERYRKAVIDPRAGASLTAAIDEVESAGPYEIGGLELKRVPPGFDAEHERAELLKHKGLHVGVEFPLPDDVHSEGLPAFCVSHFRDLQPLQDWLVGLVGAG